VTKIYQNTGQYKLQLQVKTDSGCISTIATKTIDVKPVPVVDFDLPALCVNTIASFIDKSSIADGSQNQFSYQWNFEIAGSTSTQKNPLYAYASTGNYLIKLQVTSKDGCINTLTKPVTNIFPQPMANFIVAPSTICLGETASFTNQSNALSQSIKQLSWNLDDGTSSAEQQFTHLFTSAKTYNVSLFYTTREGCNSDTVVKRVVVSPLPQVDAGPDQFILVGGQKQLMAAVTGSTGYQYQWSPSSGLNNATILQPIASPAGNITYILTVSAAGGCQSSDQVFVQVVEAPIIPNAFSPNGDGINDTWGIKYLDSYPGSTIIVFDRYGKQVYAGNGSSKPWNGTLGGKPIPVGVYYYVIDPKLGKTPITGSLTILR
jgi:gliding motility-associated-like protein